MTVDDDPELIQGFTDDVDRPGDVIMKQRAGGGTALYDAVYKGCEQLARGATPAGPAGPDVRRVLVVISDGDDNLELSHAGRSSGDGAAGRDRHLHHQHQHELDHHRSGDQSV